MARRKNCNYGRFRLVGPTEQRFVDTRPVHLKIGYYRYELTGKTLKHKNVLYDEYHCSVGDKYALVGSDGSILTDPYEKWNHAGVKPRKKSRYKEEPKTPVVHRVTRVCAPASN